MQDLVYPRSYASHLQLLFSKEIDSLSFGMTVTIIFLTSNDGYEKAYSLLEIKWQYTLNNCQLLAQRPLPGI